MGSGALLLILLMSLIQSGLDQEMVSEDTVQYYIKPVMTVKPDQPVFRGETVTLTCHIQGTGNNWWRYIWIKDGNYFYPTTTAEYSFTADVGDSGEYSCRGERSDSQTSDSAAVTLTVTDLPTSTLTVTPDSPVFTGETVNLKCVINSVHSNWRYEWYKDSRDSVLQKTERHTVNGDTLSIVGAVKTDEGWYWCEGQRDGRPNSSQSSSVSLSVKVKPVVTVKPDQPVFRGETVTLTCDIQGGNTWWRYIWIKDGNYFYPPTTTTTTTAEYSFTADVGDSGEYSCRGQRSDSQTSDISAAVTLTVTYLPTSTLTVTPDRSVFTGETVNLKCVINSEHNNWRYEWYKDSRYSVLRMSKHHTVNGDTLSIVGAVQSDEGWYWCEGQRDRRPKSSQSSSVYLFVKDLPTSTLTVTPDRSVFTGETVNLKCEIETYRNWRWRNYKIDEWSYDWRNEWKYEWYKDSSDSVLKASEHYTVNRDTLSIVGAVKTDEGWYWCKGQRDGRPNSSQSRSAVYLSVKDLPTSALTVTPDTSVFTGETVKLKCEIETNRNWRYEWYKDGSKLQSKRHTVNGDTLSIVGAVQSDEGLYWCEGQRDGRPKSSQSSSAVSLSVKDLKLKPELTSDPAGAALTGNTVTLTCRMDPSTKSWDFYWYKNTLNHETEKKNTNSYRLKIDSVSDGGQYWCRAGRGKPVYYTNYSDALWVNVTVSPKAVLTVRPDERVFRGETVTLRCDIKWGGNTEWTYRWGINGTNNLNINSAKLCTKQECCTSGINEQKHREAVSLCSTQELNISSVKYFHSGEYTCTGQMNTQISQRSDAVTLTVSAEAQAAVRVSPQPWPTEGESVTLICEVSGSSTGWTFSWFRDRDHLSDSSRGAGGSYTLSPAALQHTGVYSCRAERGRPAYYTHNSSTQPLWVTGVPDSVSLVINASRSQHFSSASLSLSCEDQSNSAGWTVRRYTDKDTKTCSKQTGSACVIESLSTSDTGVYWCESESGEKRHPRNITVHYGEVTLVSSVDPVIEGETLTLHCLHRFNSSILSADFYKDGSLVQNQTKGQMSITAVSKSHEGFYYCKTEKGQSPHSWISVRASQSLSHLVIGVSVGLSFFLLFLVSLVLLWRHKNNKDQLRNTQQISDSNRSGESHVENSRLQPGSDNIYDDVTPENSRDKDPVPSSDITYSEVTVKKKRSVDKGIGAKVKKFKSKDIDAAGPSDLTYAQINIQGKKKSNDKGKSSESGDTLYSELKMEDRGADAEVGGATYAQVFKKKGPKKNKTRT